MNGEFVCARRHVRELLKFPTALLTTSPFDTHRHGTWKCNFSCDSTLCVSNRCSLLLSRCKVLLHYSRQRSLELRNKNENASFLLCSHVCFLALICAHLKEGHRCRVWGVWRNGLRLLKKLFKLSYKNTNTTEGRNVVCRQESNLQFCLLFFILTYERIATEKTHTHTHSVPLGLGVS